MRGAEEMTALRGRMLEEVVVRVLGVGGLWAFGVVLVVGLLEVGVVP